MHNNGGSGVVVPLSRLTLLPPLNIYHSYSHKTRWRAFSQDGANDVDVAAQDEIFLLSSDGMKKKQQEKNDNKGKEISIESFQICLNISSRGRTLTPPNTSPAPLSPFASKTLFPYRKERRAGGGGTKKLYKNV